RLDVEAVRTAIRDFAPRVSAFAVAGYFGVRNPAHELAVRALIREMTQQPVTCAHELSHHLDAPRRALTALLNARLISLLDRLIRAVERRLAELEIAAPLMVVKGDGALIAAADALTRPVETILSGPAASVVDAVAVHTFGLGGDSEVRIDPELGLVVGPRRIVPLSLLAQQHAVALRILREQIADENIGPLHGRFALRARPLGAEEGGLTMAERRTWEAIGTAAAPLTEVLGS